LKAGIEVRLIPAFFFKLAAMRKKFKIGLPILWFALFASMSFSQESQKWSGYWETSLNLPPHPPSIQTPTLFSASALVWIRIYQKAISTQDLPSCAFHPSCSRFAFAAINEFGIVKGVLLAGDRLMRCNPFAVAYYPFDGEKFADSVKNYRLK